MSDLFARLWRRVQLLVAVARVPLSDDTGGVQTMQLQVDADEVIDGAPRFADFGFSSRAPAGSTAVVVCMGGMRTHPLVIATGHQPSRPRNLQPGEAILYSEDGKFVKITASGGIEVQAKGQPVTVNNAGAVTVNATSLTVNLSGAMTMKAPGGVAFDTPSMKVTGDITDTSATNTRTMGGMRTVYDTHTHPDPDGDTGVPNQLM